MNALAMGIAVTATVILSIMSIQWVQYMSGALEPFGLLWVMVPVSMILILCPGVAVFYIYAGLTRWIENRNGV